MLSLFTTVPTLSASEVFRTRWPNFTWKRRNAAAFMLTTIYQRLAESGSIPMYEWATRLRRTRRSETIGVYGLPLQIELWASGAIAFAGG